MDNYEESVLSASLSLLRVVAVLIIKAKPSDQNLILKSISVCNIETMQLPVEEGLILIQM